MESPKEPTSVLINQSLVNPSLIKNPNEKSPLVSIMLIAIVIILIVFGAVVILVVVLHPAKPIIKSDDLYLNHYSVSKIIPNNDFSLSYILSLDANPEFHDNDIKPTSNNTESNSLNVTFSTESDHLFKVMVNDDLNSRWKVPFSFSDDYYNGDEAFVSYVQRYKIREINFNSSNISDRLRFYLSDKKGVPILKFNHTFFRFLDKYIVFEIEICSQILTGLNYKNNLFLDQGSYIIYLQNTTSQFTSYPFIMFQTPDKLNWAGLYMKNSNPFQIDIKFTENKTSILRYTLIAGIIEFYAFYAGTPDFILQEYHNFIGRIPLIPYWALGYHQGIISSSFNEISQKVQNFSALDLPLDSIWTGFEIYQDGKNFIVDSTKYSQLGTFINSYLHPNNISIVAEVQPGIKNSPDYIYYQNLISSNLAVLSNVTSRPLIGLTQAGYSVFPDFINPKIQAYWNNCISGLSSQISFDGLYLSKNEINNMCNGECKTAYSIANQYDNYPFLPGNMTLNQSTISPDAIHLNGEDEFNVHPFSTSYIAQSTYLSSPFSVRKLLISEAAGPGSQKYSGLIDSYNNPTWNDLISSISLMLEHNIQGLPFTGSDICSFNGTSETDLCLRWMQLGLFYPLSRNTKNPSIPIQDPTTFSDLGISTSINAIRQKYSLLRLYYTKFFEASLFGGIVINPLYFEYPNDYYSFKYSNREFMIGHSVLVIPALEPNISKISGYFPNSNYYDIRTGKLITSYNPESITGTFEDVDAQYDYVSTFVKGGTIIPYQEAFQYHARNAKDLINIPTTLIIALDENNKAKGSIIADDGLSANDIYSEKYRHYSLTYSNKVIKINLIHGFQYNDSFGNDNLTVIKIYGANIFNDTLTACMFTSNLQPKTLSFSYDPLFQVLTLTDPGKRKSSLRSIESIMFGSADDYNECAGGFIATNIKITDNLRRLSSTLVTNMDLSGLTFSLNALLITNNILNLKITPLDRKVWETPDIVNSSFRNTSTASITFSDYMFAISTDPDNFYFQISDPSDPEITYITTQNFDFVIGEHFVEFQTAINASEFYGIGERISSFKLKSGTYTIAGRDQLTPIDDGTIPAKNTYGNHPFYMFKLPDNSYGGLFILSSNMMDITITQFDVNVFQVAHSITGGSLDLFYILKGDPKFVISQYMEIIGKPQLMPFWSFGHHQCRYGYTSQKMLEDVIKNYLDNKIPIESIWVDIDYMDEYTGFTVDTSRYPNLTAFHNNISSHNIKFVPIVDAGIKFGNNSAFNEGVAKNVFIQNRNRNNWTVGIVWPGYSTFVDFLNPNSSDYWSGVLNDFHNVLPFDGIWLDMNEVSNFCSGDCKEGMPFIGHYFENGDYDDLPYIPGHRIMDYRSVSMNSVHYGDPKITSEYNLHNIFGHMEAISTYNALKNSPQKKRPFILSRSTFVSSGRYTAHWLGDNFSSDIYLKNSIAGIFNFHMFGIPLVGPDTCGFGGDTTVDLCKRWYQLAAFYPFCRNHNSIGSIPQEPYTNPDLMRSAKASLFLRYSILRYIYTCHAIFALNGMPYFTPVFFSYPNDPNATIIVENSFLLGEALLVSPILDEKGLSTTTYFPEGIWYDLNGKVVLNGSGKNMTFLYDDIKPNFNIRGGNGFSWQDASANVAQTTVDLIKLPTSFILGTDINGYSAGYIYFDENNDIDTLDTMSYHLIKIELNGTIITFTQLGNSRYVHEDGKDELINEIQILGKPNGWIYGKVCAYKFSGDKVRISSSFDNFMWHLQVNSAYGYNEVSKILINDNSC